MTRILKSVFYGFFFLLIIPVLPAYSEQTPTEQLKLLIADLQKNPNDNALREKIIRHVRTMKPAPAVPKEAERYMVRGIAAMKEAKSTDDLKDAVKEFEKALLSAPWYADVYYNLGIAQDKAGLYDKAIKNLNLYMVAAQNAPDVKAVEKLIYEIEYRQEKAAKESSPEAKVKKKQKDEEEFIKSLNGALYQLRETYKYGASDVDTWEIRGNRIFRIYLFQDPTYPGNLPPSESNYSIKGRQFFIDYETSFCKEIDSRANNCGYIGTISEKAITFEFQIDGRKASRPGVGPNDYIPRLK
jgi:tetratricopeptide (TPR) repeat protein